MSSERYLSDAVLEYTRSRVDSNPHPAFEDPDTARGYSPVADRFLDLGRLELQQRRQQQGLQASVQNPAPIDKLAKERKENFQKALDEYLGTPSAKKTLSKLVEETTWDDVQKLMREAEGEYQSVGTIRNHLHRFGKNAPIFNSWLALLPEASYSSTIYDGFRIMFDAAGKLPGLRDKVFEILGEIPDRIAKTQVYAELYRSSQQVQGGSLELYVAILDIFEHVLGWLAKLPLGKFGKVLLRGQLHSGELDKKVSKMRDVAENLRKVAELRPHDSLGRVKDGRLVQENKLQNLELANHEILRNSLNANYTAQMQALKLSEIYNTVYQLLQTSTNYDKDTRQANTPQLKGDSSRQATQRKAHSTELLKSLSLSPDDLAATVRTSLRHGHSASLAEKDRANWIMKSGHMSTWLTSTASITLLVNANGEDKKISPLSFITALLVQSLTQSDTPVLHFFCGDSTSDTGGGPLSLIRSLTAQLLTYYDFDLTGIWHSRRGAPKTTKQLCTLFKALLMQLPDDAVLFILIDGITYFENADRREEICIVIGQLHEIMPGAGALIKLLVLAPSKSRYVIKVLQNEGEGDGYRKGAGMGEGSSWLVLDVPVNPDGGRVGLSVPYWEERTSASVRGLGRMADRQSDGEGKKEGRGGRLGEGRRRAMSDDGGVGWMTM